MAIPNSARLSFAIMTRDDTQSFFELDQNPKVMLHINGGKPSTMDEIESVYIPRMESYTTPEKGWGIWKVSLVDSNQFIGWVLVRPMHYFSDQRDDTDLELGWRFFEEQWGKGYATEAATAIMNWLESELGYRKFSAIALEGNHASTNLMKKLGMKYLKTAVHSDPLGDEECVYYQRTVSM